MDLAIHLEGDPNANRNRVPEKNELGTLRTFVQRNERMIQDLDQQLQETRETRAAIQRRFEEQIRAIEGTRSELLASDRFLSMLEAQKSSIQNDLTQLCGLINPVRRCPSDVLQRIFEWTVEMEEPSWFSAATTLSHVCQRWREVALQTPSLWANFTVSLTDRPEDLSAFWERMITRVQLIPPTILIQDGSGRDAEWHVLRECRLDLLPHVEQLELRLDLAETAKRLASVRPLYAGRLDHLQLSCKKDADFPINLSAIANRFPSVPSVAMVGGQTITFKTDLVLFGVTKLTIVQVSKLSFEKLAQAFPNVEAVLLEGVSFRTHVGGEICWPKLRSMKAALCHRVPWSSLKVPSINKFSLMEGATEDVLTFISSHPSLRHLDVAYSGERMHSVAENAPNIYTLTTDPCDDICDQDRMKLARLTNLSLYHCQEDPISIELFEKILQSRFLPKSGSDQSIKSNRTIPSLTILVEPEIRVEDLAWLKSGLLSAAIREVSNLERWNTNYMAYRFRWN